MVLLLILSNVEQHASSGLWLGRGPRCICLTHHHAEPLRTWYLMSSPGPGFLPRPTQPRRSGSTQPSLDSQPPGCTGRLSLDFGRSLRLGRSVETRDLRSLCGREGQARKGKKGERTFWRDQFGVKGRKRFLHVFSFGPVIPRLLKLRLWGLGPRLP